MHRPATWLCLGDSYTVGEGVPLSDSFPYQTAALLRRAGYAIHAPEIVAQTGWTTDELLLGIEQRALEETYDFVSLLIGVNNQYRSRSTSPYAAEFTLLLKQALGFSGNQPNQVIVLSIPDWGATPFAADRDQQKISVEINQFNKINEGIAVLNEVNYINITPGSRKASEQKELLAADGLHPSGLLYHTWALELARKMQENWPSIR